MLRPSSRVSWTIPTPAVKAAQPLTFVLVNAARPQNIVALDQSLQICRMSAKVPRSGVLWLSYQYLHYFVPGKAI
jgi:hypothetical protein